MSISSRVLLSICLFLCSGCIQHSEAKIQVGKIRIDRISENRSPGNWNIQFRIRNDENMQKKVELQVTLDFEDSQYEHLERKLIEGRILTLQTKEQRVVMIPLGRRKGLEVDWKARYFARRIPQVNVIGSRVYY